MPGILLCIWIDPRGLNQVSLGCRLTTCMQSFACYLARISLHGRVDRRDKVYSLHGINGGPVLPALVPLESSSAAPPKRHAPVSLSPILRWKSSVNNTGLGGLQDIGEFLGSVRQDDYSIDLQVLFWTTACGCRSLASCVV